MEEITPMVPGYKCTGRDPLPRTDRRGAPDAAEDGFIGDLLDQELGGLGSRELTHFPSRELSWQDESKGGPGGVGHLDPLIRERLDIPGKDQAAFSLNGRHNRPYRETVSTAAQDLSVRILNLHDTSGASAIGRCPSSLA
jgi:hypothetical protein